MVQERDSMIHARTGPRRRRGGALFKLGALLVIGGRAAWAAAHGYVDIMRTGRAQLDHIVLLFICVELGAIVMRFFAIDVRQLSIERLVAVSMVILVLTLAALTLRIARLQFCGRDGRALADDRSSE